jgi:hypothetical protein
MSGSLSYADTEGTIEGMSFAGVIKSVVTKRITRIKQNIAITEVAVNLGNISAPGYAIFQNRDVTNSINLKVASGGAIFASLDPDVNANGQGGFAFLKLGSGAQVPYAIALVATCQMDIFIVST